MIVSVIPIGNSKGIRIPKKILDELDVRDRLDMEIEEESIVLRPIKSTAREGWETAFLEMKKKGEDALIMDDEENSELIWEW